MVGILFLSSCWGINSNESNPGHDKMKNWYEGGTLHSAKISAWKSATDENKLATCADFMAAYDNTVSMSVLKIRATELKSCIDEAVRGQDMTNDDSVASIAALCTKALGY